MNFSINPDEAKQLYKEGKLTIEQLDSEYEKQRISLCQLNATMLKGEYGNVVVNGKQLHIIEAIQNTRNMIYYINQLIVILKGMNNENLMLE